MSNSGPVLGGSEFFRVAERLVKARGASAAAYVEMKIMGTKEIDDVENQTYWENILKEVEKLLYVA
ncbi:MAG: hypothetical protein O3B76_06040 [Proteobacteria bacterium]|nr:hypothetical protein [Pseudomonadota bacterium]